MPETDQNETRAFLSRPGAFGPLAAAPIDTHISHVLIFETRVLKLKRAVKFGYVDFSSPEKRLAACEAELALNRRTAPDLYRALHRVTRARHGGLELDGPGPLVDALVEMTRFDAAGLFDRLALTGGLTRDLLTRLAGRIAAFHAEAEVAGGSEGAARMARVLDVNAAAFATTDIFSASERAALDASFRQKLAALAPLLDARAAAGKVRRCHGDLHLRNICLFDGEPTLFDCLEFNADLATTDILYDIAFLLMDLWHRDLRPEANLVFNRYLDALDEEEGVALLPFLMAVRAAVRAHVTATQAGADPALRSEAQGYFDLARALLAPCAPRLVAVGGFSGSGKSTVATGIAPALAPAPGARVLSSDRLRKRLYNVAPETPLPAEAYAPEVSRRVYGELTTRAARLIALGQSVIADAVFDRTDSRARIAEASGSASFTGLWLAAAPDRLDHRIRARVNDPSDATPEVLRQQIARAGSGPPDDLHWHSIAADADPAEVRATALRTLGAPSA